MNECEYCGRNVPDGTAACPACGFPARGTDEEKYQFLYMKSIPLKTDMNGAQDGLKKSRTALYVAGGLALLNCLLLTARISHPADPAALVTMIAITGLLGAAFILLGVFLNKNPLAISIAGLVLGLIFLHSSIIGIVVILVLAFGVWCAVKYNTTKRKYDELRRKISKYGES